MNVLHKNSLSTISRIRENANRFIIEKLAESGFDKLAPSHGDILAVLYNSKDVTMKNIADRIHRTKPTVTVLTDKLEKLGFVSRDKSENDSRITYIRLTPLGESFKSEFERISIQLNEMLYKNFSKDEIETLNNLLEKMAKNT